MGYFPAGPAGQKISEFGEITRPADKVICLIGVQDNTPDGIIAGLMGKRDVFQPIAPGSTIGINKCNQRPLCRLNTYISGSPGVGLFLELN